MLLIIILHYMTNMFMYFADGKSYLHNNSTIFISISNMKKPEDQRGYTVVAKSGYLAKP